MRKSHCFHNGPKVHLTISISDCLSTCLCVILSFFLSLSRSLIISINLSISLSLCLLLFLALSHYLNESLPSSLSLSLCLSLSLFSPCLKSSPLFFPIFSSCSHLLFSTLSQPSPKHRQFSVPLVLITLIQTRLISLSLSPFMPSSFFPPNPLSPSFFPCIVS